MNINRKSGEAFHVHTQIIIKDEMKNSIIEKNS